MRPFGCLVIILNTIDHLRSGPNWLFYRDALTKSMNYKPVVAGNQSDGSTDLLFSSSSMDSPGAGFKPSGEEEKKDVVDPRNKDSGDNAVDENIVYGYANDLNIPELEEIGKFGDAKNDDSGADMNNLDTYFQVSLVPTIRIHNDHPLNQVIGDLQSSTQTRRMTKNLEEYKFVSTTLKQRTSHKDFQNCLFACFLSQEEPKKIDVNSAFLYGKIEEEVYVCQPPSFKDPDFPDRVYKVKNALYGLHQAPRAWKEMCTKFEKIMHTKFQMSSMGELTFFLGLQVKQKEDGIFISQDKYVNEILNKFGFSDVKTASTPMETHKTLLKDEKKEKIALYTNDDWNEVKQLLRMELSSTMASAIICLATNQKFNFSKYISDSMVKHLDSGNKFLMYPRFVQVFLDKQVDGMSKHTAIYVTPSHTKKVFSNMRMVGKYFSGRDTPLFPTMLVQAQADMGKGSTMPSAPQHTPPFIQPTISKPQKKQKPRKPKRHDTEEISPRINRLEKKKKSRTYGLKRLYKVGLSERVESSNEESLGEEDATKQERKFADIDADKGLTLIDETKKDQGRINDEEMIDTDVLNNEEMFAESVDVAEQAKEIVANKDLIDDIILAKVLMEIKVTAAGTRPKAKSIVMQEPSETPKTTTIPISSKVQTKEKEEEQGQLTVEKSQDCLWSSWIKERNILQNLKQKSREENL
nr:retrotransposon protein, putative, unclassified [Tanacetum cinerariifolium]